MENRKPIKIKTAQEIEILRQGAKILSAIIRDLACSLKPGITSAELDNKAEKLAGQHKVRPAFKGYRGFPASLCVSVNQEIVHGVPGDRALQDGDIVSIDMGIVHKNYYCDMAVTQGVGKIPSQLQTLLDVTKSALFKGIDQARENKHLSDISAAIQNFCESYGFSVVRDFVGHGIGRNLHEEPEIPNFGLPHCGPQLKEGMVFCIEPMVNMGTWQAKIKEDGWTVETLDGKPSAHFEHMVVVGKSRAEVLTES